jgi:prevent-host-death family protein
MSRTTEIGVFEAKTHLSQLLQRVAEGERFIITRRGERIAELRPVTTEKPRLERGCAKNPGYFMAPDFDDPVADLEEYM